MREAASERPTQTVGRIGRQSTLSGDRLSRARRHRAAASLTFEDVARADDRFRKNAAHGMVRRSGKAAARVAQQTGGREAQLSHPSRKFRRCRGCSQWVAWFVKIGRQRFNALTRKVQEQPILVHGHQIVLGRNGDGHGAGCMSKTPGVVDPVSPIAHLRIVGGQHSQRKSDVETSRSRSEEGSASIAAERGKCGHP